MLAIASWTWFVATRTKSINKIGLKCLIDFLAVLPILVLVSWLFLLCTGLRVNWGGTIFNCVMILETIELVIYFRKSHDAMVKEKLQQRELMLKRFSLMKAKVNPHFLFNSINMLYSMIDVDPKRSQSLALSLSRYYRQIMLDADKNVVPLRDELEFTKYFINIMIQRYGNEFVVEFSGEPQPKAFIVAHALQLMLENVVKHNEISSDAPMKVNITFTPDGVYVENPIVPRLSNNKTGFGMEYLKEIYRLNGKEIQVSRENGKYKVFIPFV